MSSRVVIRTRLAATRHQVESRRAITSNTLRSTNREGSLLGAALSNGVGVPVDDVVLPGFEVGQGQSAQVEFGARVGQVQSDLAGFGLGVEGGALWTVAALLRIQHEGTLASCAGRQQRVGFVGWAFSGRGNRVSPNYLLDLVLVLVQGDLALDNVGCSLVIKPKDLGPLDTLLGSEVQHNIRRALFGTLPSRGVELFAILTGQTLSGRLIDNTIGAWLTPIELLVQDLALGALLQWHTFAQKWTVDLLGGVALGFGDALVGDFIQEGALGTLLVGNTFVDASVQVFLLAVALHVGLAGQGLRVEELVVADDDFVAPVGDLVDVEASRALFEGDTLVVDSVQPSIRALHELLALVGLSIEPFLSTLDVVLAQLGSPIEELVGITVDQANAGTSLAIQVGSLGALLLGGLAWHTGSPPAIEDISLLASNTLAGVKIEQGLSGRAADALATAEERCLDVTVGDVVVADGPLVVLLNHIVQSLIAEDPVLGVEVGLPDGGRQDGPGHAPRLQNGDHIIHEVELGAQVQIHLPRSIAHWGAVQVLLQIDDVVPHSVEFVDDGLLLIRPEVLARTLGDVQGRQQGLRRAEHQLSLLGDLGLHDVHLLGVRPRRLELHHGGRQIGLDQVQLVLELGLLLDQLAVLRFGIPGRVLGSGRRQANRQQNQQS